MIRPAVKTDTDELLRMRERLFDDYTREELLREIEENFTSVEHPYFDDVIMFVYEKEDGTLGGYVEVSIIKSNKIDDFNLYVACCTEVRDKPNQPRLEAWYVDENLRRQHIGETLVRAAERWAVQRGFHIVLSDTDTFREASILAHQSMDYEIAARISDKELVLFLKQLGQK
jgi:GNAT superfamily N-acetyltransferase